MLKEKIRAQILYGSLKNCKNHLAGIYKGYYITMDTQSPHYILNIHATNDNPDEEPLLTRYLNEQTVDFKQLKNAKIVSNVIVLTIAIPNLVKNTPMQINPVVDRIINYLIENRYRTGCANCGNMVHSLSRYDTNGEHFYLCDECATEIHAKFEGAQADVKARKSHLPAGLAGAFLGALIGAVLWVLIYRLGYIAGIAGAVTAVCAFKGYEMFGKNLDLKGCIVSVLVMLAVIFLANRIAWAWEAYDALKEFDLTFADCYRNLDLILADAELTGAYYSEYAVGVGLTILASIRTIINTFKESMGSYKFKKVNE